MFLVSSYALRAAGRAFNPTYLTFLKILARAGVEPNSENMELVRRYDFAFGSWPVGFTASKLSRLGREALVGEVGGGGGVWRQRMNKYTPCWILSWAAAHTFGIRLMYPGLLIAPLLKNVLQVGVVELVATPPWRWHIVWKLKCVFT